MSEKKEESVEKAESHAGDEETQESKCYTEFFIAALYNNASIVFSKVHAKLKKSSPEFKPWIFTDSH